ncbi:MAG: hypothetical protein KIC94_20280 [Clostridiales bacterium]|nr:hypothetical protein [Clostridiales bacterium]
MEKLKPSNQAYIKTTLNIWKWFLEEDLITEEEYYRLVKNIYIEFGGKPNNK